MTTPFRSTAAAMSRTHNPHSTYYDGRLRQGPALIRARRPYLFKNALTGLGLVAVVGGIYYYTLRAVGQDEFDDVKVPDVPRKAAETR